LVLVVHFKSGGRAKRALAIKLGSWYERTGEITDLEKAIGIARQAVESTPDDHPGRASYLNNLGGKLQRRYERTGEMADLEEAIGAARQDAGRVSYLHNLGSKLRRRYERTGGMADLEKAIGVARQAVESTPDDHPDRAARLFT
jgi:tetratricopeptide (TPR) repeat protein